MNRPSDIELAKWAVWRAQNDFNYFCSWLKTRDEATGFITPWPSHYEHVRAMGEWLRGVQIGWIPKSRRAFATWTMCAYLLWRGMRDEVYYGVLQSRTEDLSKEFLRDNVWVLWSSIPRWMKWVWFQGDIEAKHNALEIALPNGNRIKGMAQGPHVARGKTPSVVVLEEAAFHPEIESTVEALLPLAEKNAQLLFLSSVDPGFFNEVVTGKKEGETRLLVPSNGDLPPRFQKGVQAWTLKHGGEVLQVHFSADPSKDKEWLDEQDKKFPGGVLGPKFLKEYNIEANANSGQRVYAHFSQEKHVKEFEPIEGNRSWLVVDYGTRNPTAALRVEDLGDQRYGVYREFYQAGMSIKDLKIAFWQIFGPPENYEDELIDPSTDAVREADTKSHYYLFNNGGWARKFRRADNSKDGRVLISEWLHNGQLIVHPQCEQTIWEFENYYYDKWAEATARKHNPKEKVVKKNDHAMDALKYFANAVRWEQLPAYEGDGREPTLAEKVFEQMEEEDSYWAGGEQRTPAFTAEQLRERL